MEERPPAIEVSCECTEKAAAKKQQRQLRGRAWGSHPSTVILLRTVYRNPGRGRILWINDVSDGILKSDMEPECYKFVRGRFTSDSECDIGSDGCHTGLGGAGRGGTHNMRGNTHLFCDRRK
jgi:hypothetical protein